MRSTGALRFVVDGCPVRLQPFRLLPAGVDAITFPSLILIRPCYAHSIDLLVHEATHVRQWRRHGVLGFIGRYLRDYLVARRSGAGHHQAYLSISFEVDARKDAEPFVE
jgi:hypothetical protein